MTASYDRTACLYGPKEGEPYVLLHRYHFPGTVEAVAFSPDSAYVTFTARDDNYLHYVRLEDSVPTKYNMNQNGDDFVSFVGMDGARKVEGGIRVRMRAGLWRAWETGWCAEAMLTSRCARLRALAVHSAVFTGRQVCARVHGQVPHHPLPGALV